jgi:hypothetical protein
MSSRVRQLSTLLCAALLASASGVAAQAAPAPSANAQAPAAAVPAPEAAAPAAAPESAAPAPEAAPAPGLESAQDPEETAQTPEQPAAPAPEASTVTTTAETQSTTGLTLRTATADAKIDTDEQPEQPQTCGSGSIALSSGGCTKPWRVIGYGEYRQLAVTDEDPQAGRSLRFFVQGSYRVAKKYNVSVWGRIRYLQNFVAEEGESAARFQDPLVGIDYMQSLSYADRGQEWANLFLQHRINGTIPAQRETRANDLYTRISVLERVRLIPIPSVYVGPDLTAGYNFFEYAEQPNGPVNEQADFSGLLVAEWYPWQHDKFGSILLGVDAGVGYAINYKGRPGEAAQAENRWSQNYAWDVYAYYMPIPQIWLGAALSHGMGLLRDGVANVDFVNRDATLLSFSAIALY